MSFVAGVGWVEMNQTKVESTELDRTILLEHERLVHLCLQLTGDPDVAEDLAQETLLEAWRNKHKLYDPQGLPQWLSAIARRVCLCWLRGLERERSRLMLSSLDDGSLSVDQLALLAEPYDLETELEHQELLELLDRAFGLLSPQVRQVLIERYVHESPNAEIAARMGLSKGAVAMRLSRGKSKLRMLLRRLALTPRPPLPSSDGRGGVAQRRG